MFLIQQNNNIMCYFKTRKANNISFYLIEIKIVSTQKPKCWRLEHERLVDVSEYLRAQMEGVAHCCIHVYVSVVLEHC